MSYRERILRFPQARKKSEFVLVQTVQKGSHPLDLELVGTDGLQPFVVSLRNGKWSKLKHSCGDQEWADILKAVLCQEVHDGIQTAAKVESGQLTIELRRNAAGMTKHLGDIALQVKEELEIDVVGWCGVSVLAFDECNQELAEQRAKAQNLENEITELKAQLDELIEAKKAEDAELLEKFRDLLNQKKVKIREQQRVLATASINPEKLAASQAASQKEAKSRAPRPSRASKRKAAAVPIDESDDDGFEAMDVDKIKKESSSDSEQGGRTTDAETDADATASEDEAYEEAPAMKPVAVEQPPPTRELPFATKKSKEPPARVAPQPSTSTAVGSETESDDEL